MTNENKTLGIAIEQIDNLFFRDGKPFGPEIGNHVASRLPTPQTLAGALRTALLAVHDFDFTHFRSLASQHRDKSIKTVLNEINAPKSVTELSIRGPWLALQDKNSGDITPLVHTPLNLYASKTTRGDNAEEILEWSMAAPLRSSLPNYMGPTAKPIWSRAAGNFKQPGGFLNLDGLDHYLKGELPPTGSWFAPSSLFTVEKRTGIAINPKRGTVSEGLIYTAGFLNLNPNLDGKKVIFYAEVTHENKKVEDCGIDALKTIPFGGEGRYVSISKTKAVAWPTAEPQDKQGQLIMLKTPGVFLEGWKPRCLEDSIEAAAVGQPLAVSGWDISRGGPRPTRFAAPAGSVYFLTPGRNTSFETISDDKEDRQQGFGEILKGVWNHV